MRFGVVWAMAGVLCVTGAPAAVWADEGDWYAETGVLFLTREEQDGQTLVSSMGLELVNSEDNINFDYEAGGYGRVGRYISRDTAVEFSFFVVEMDESAEAVGVNTLDVFPPSLFTSDFDDADFVDIDYDSDVINLELNARREFGGGVAAYVGGRYINIDEEMTIAATDFNPFIGANVTSSYEVETENHLIGAHGGGSITRSFFRDRLSVSGHGGGGVFANIAEQDQTLGDFGNGITLRNEDDDDVDFAWLVEAGINARWHITPNVHVESGYTVIYIDGLALAPENADLRPITSGTSIDVDGSLVYHGAYVGVGFLF